jgi:hypothetical protein
MRRPAPCASKRSIPPENTVESGPIATRDDQRCAGTLLATLYGALDLVPEKVVFVRARRRAADGDEIPPFVPDEIGDVGITLGSGFRIFLMELPTERGDRT